MFCGGPQGVATSEKACFWGYHGDSTGNAYGFPSFQGEIEGTRMCFDCKEIEILHAHMCFQKITEKNRGNANVSYLCFLGLTDGCFFDMCFQKEGVNAHVYLRKTPKKQGVAYVFCNLKRRMAGNAHVSFLCFFVFPKNDKKPCVFQARQRCVVKFLQGKSRGCTDMAMDTPVEAVP